jgi:GNAT superfamily N-acetyltransferase
MTLRDALPLEIIATRYPEAREVVLADSVAALQANLLARIPPVGLFVWDEMAFRGDTKKPEKMQKIYPYHAERMFPFVTKELGRVPISDAYYAEWFNGLSDDKPFIKVELCQCYPNDIHIADIVFADLSRPIRDNCEVAPRSHRGLGIFDEFLGRLRGVARDRGVERISLVAASPAAHMFFSKHGFQVSPTLVGQTAFETLGYSHPMFMIA